MQRPWLSGQEDFCDFRLADGAGPYRSSLPHRIYSDLRYRLAGEEGEEVDFTHVITTHLGLRLRLMEARRKIFALARKKGRRYWLTDHYALRFHAPIGAAQLFDYMAQISEALCSIAERPLTPRQLLQLVPISTRERLRWTKDGRLPPCGTNIVRDPQCVRVPLYSVALAEWLLKDLSVIECWRAQDAQAQYDTDD